MGQAIGSVLPLAWSQWRGRPHGDTEPELPGWMKTIDTLTPVKSAGLGALLAGPNPKNLVLTIAAGVAIAQAGISAGDQVIVFAIFVAIATLGRGLPLGITTRSATGPARPSEAYAPG